MRAWHFNHLIIVLRHVHSHAHSIALPDNPPSISVTSRHPIPDDVCGEAMSLSCTANLVEGLVTAPTIVWIDPSGNLVPTGENYNPKVDAETRNLVFSDVTLNNRGVYTCRAVVSIPEALISNYSDESTIPINTTCKLKWTSGYDIMLILFYTAVPGVVKNLNCAMSSSPNHLLFSWELPTLLGNEVIDYGVEVKKLQTIEDTQNLMELEIASFKTNKMIANITQGLGEV